MKRRKIGSSKGSNIILKEGIEDKLESIKDSENLPFQIDFVNLFKASHVRMYVIGDHFRMKKQKDFVDEQWEDFSSEEKVAFLLTHTEYNRSVQVSISRKKSYMFHLHPLQFLLKRVEFSLLKNLYRKYVLKDENSSLGIDYDEVCMDLILKFYGKRTFLERRSIERENLKVFGEDFFQNNEEFRFVEICNQVVPSDVIFIIFRFLPRDFSIMYNIGSVNKLFYLVILSTWKRLRITNNSVLKNISLLVLSRIEELEIDGGEYGSLNIDNKKLNYVIQNLGKGNVKRLSISTYFKSKKCILQYFKSQFSSSSFPMTQLQYLQIDYHHFKFRLSRLFPNLETLKICVHETYNWMDGHSINVDTDTHIYSIIKGLTNLKNLIIDEGIQPFLVMFSLSLKNDNNEFFTQLSRLKKLEFLSVDSNRFFKDPNFSVFPKMLRKCEALSDLNIKFESSSNQPGGNLFDFMTLRKHIFEDNQNGIINIRRLRRLVIDASKRTGFEHSRDFGGYDNNVEEIRTIPVKYPEFELPVEELQIVSFQSEEDFASFDIDFNFQDLMMNRSFFLNDDGSNHLKKLYVCVPFTTRRRRYKNLKNNKRRLYVAKKEILPALKSVFSVILLGLASDSNENSKLEQVEFSIDVCDTFFKQENFTIVIEKMNDSFRKLYVSISELHDDLELQDKILYRYNTDFFEDEESLLKYLITDRGKNCRSIVVMFITMLIFHGGKMEEILRVPGSYDVIEIHFQGVAYGSYYLKNVLERLRNVVSEVKDDQQRQLYEVEYNSQISEDAEEYEKGTGSDYIFVITRSKLL